MGTPVSPRRVRALRYLAIVALIVSGQGSTSSASHEADRIRPVGAVRYDRPVLVRGPLKKGGWLPATTKRLDDDRCAMAPGVHDAIVREHHSAAVVAAPQTAPRPHPAAKPASDPEPAPCRNLPKGQPSYVAAESSLSSRTRTPTLGALHLWSIPSASVQVAVHQPK